MNHYHFLDSKRKDPRKALAEERVKNFKEIYSAFNETESKDQAARCIDCGIPYCKWSCPVVNHIPEWLKLVAKGDIIKAAELSNETNSLPEICGRVCPQDRLCEGACTLNAEYGAVSIGNIEKYISDTAFSLGWEPKKATKWHLDKLVSIIGAGPAGLAAEDYLSRSGIPVKVYDRYAEIGGLPSYGIPNFKLEKEIVLRRRKILEKQGVEFILNTEVDKNLFSEIYENSSAVFLALGTYKARSTDFDLKSSKNIFLALDYLISRIEMSFDFKAGKTRSEIQEKLLDKDVVILGGGDTAMDCARTALRDGAKSVKCLYRRDLANIPGSRREIENAIEEGLEFIWNTQVTGIENNAEKLILSTVETELQIGTSKRMIPVNKIGSEKTLACDYVIVAYGFNPSPADWFTDFGIQTDASGKVLVSKDKETQFQTANPKIFAGGDMVRGSDLVVTAIYEGRNAAEAIKRKLLTIYL